MDAVDDWVTAPAAPAAAPEGKDDWVTAPAAKAEHWAAPAGGEFGDLAAQSAAPAPEPGAIQRVIGEGVKGAVEGFGRPVGQTILSPAAQEWMDAKQRGGGVGGFLAGLGSTVAEDVGSIGAAAAGVGNSLFRGAQGVVAQTGAELGAPKLGRDLAAIPEAFMGSPEMLAKAPAGSGVLPRDSRYIPRTAAEGNLLADFPRSPDLTVTARQIQERDGVGIMEAWQRAHTENAAAAVAKIGDATDIDGAIAAAGKAAFTPGDPVVGRAGIYGGAPDVTKGPFDFSAPSAAQPARVTSSQVQARDGVGAVEAGRRAAAENAAADAAQMPGAGGVTAPLGGARDGAVGAAGMDAHDTAAAAAGWRRLSPDEPRTIGQAIATDPNTGREYVQDTAGTQPIGGVPSPQSVGAAASRDNTLPADIAMAPDEFAANRAQGEVERLALPPAMGDRNIYIPGTKLTLAEVSGNPKDAMDQAYNRQQPESMAQHIAQENHNADTVADYYADTAGSAPTLLRMERARDATAQSNIQSVFGDPQSARAPADPSPTINLMDGMLTNPRQAERNSVVKILSSLAEKFYGEDGNLKTDPYALYGIGEHINDLLRGTGDTETNGAARVLKRELVQIKESLYSDIENAAPGFAKYRADYQRDSQAIDAMQLLQDARLSLLSGTNQHITPAKWFGFMRNIVEGRADPMDAASALSEAQMDRLWNITDHLKRTTLIDAGKPRGSWTSMMQEWGGRFARLGAHGIAAGTFPVVGNLAVEMGVAGLRKRSVSKEMQRVLNPDLGQPQP